MKLTGGWGAEPKGSGGSGPSDQQIRPVFVLPQRHLIWYKWADRTTFFWSERNGRGVLLRLWAFVPFKTTELSNQAFDWTNFRSSVAGIMSTVEWFKPPQPHTNSDIRPIRTTITLALTSQPKLDSTNQGFGLNHVIRRSGQVTRPYTEATAVVQTLLEQREIPPPKICMCTRHVQVGTLHKNTF